MPSKPALAALLGAYGPLAVFAAVVVESVFAFLPTPPVILAAGALVVPAALPPGAALVALGWRVAAPGALGTAVGGLALYGLFWAGGRPLVERCGRWFGVTWPKVERLGARLAKRRAALLFVSRALPFVPTALVSSACGVLRISPWSFVLWSVLGAFPRWLLLGWLGWAGKTASLAALASWYH